MIRKYLYNNQFPYWLIAFSFLIGLTLPKLIQDGMFMDAMLYTSVAHNLGIGIGTFWFPQFSLYNVGELPSFHEQPPLVFGIQSIFFRILGNSMYVERIYTFLTMCITAVMINLLWKEIFRNEEKLKRVGWLSIILWITIPVCFWSYSNNMHENTMGIFTLLSVFLMFKAIQSPKHYILIWILSGISIFLATFSKGFPGFFPITFPLIYWIITKKLSFKRAVVYSLIITVIPVIIYSILFIIPESKESLSIYLFKRAFHRINDVPTVDNRFYILYRLFTELLPQIIFVFIIFLINGLKKVKSLLYSKVNVSLLFLFVGLSGSMPLLLTLVQKGFYFVPSLPFFAIGLSVLIAPFVLAFIEKSNIKSNSFKLFYLFSLVLFFSILTFSVLQKGKVGRDKDIINDVYEIGKVVPKYTAISITQKDWNNWSLQCYLIRYFNISLDPVKQNEFFLAEKSVNPVVIPDYNKVIIKTSAFELYKRQ